MIHKDQQYAKRDRKITLCHLLAAKDANRVSSTAVVVELVDFVAAFRKSKVVVVVDADNDNDDADDDFSLVMEEVEVEEEEELVAALIVDDEVVEEVCSMCNETED
ncbi:hypothetical protein DOY81_004204 [Sarcophaga bullata]|nr:hypothetical protein DOY81_004204 [Sarcophaga bullata]